MSCILDLQYNTCCLPNFQLQVQFPGPGWQFVAAVLDLEELGLEPLAKAHMHHMPHSMLPRDQDCLLAKSCSGHSKMEKLGVFRKMGTLLMDPEWILTRVNLVVPLGGSCPNIPGQVSTKTLCKSVCHP